MNTIYKTLVVLASIWVATTGTSQAQEHDVRLVFGKTVDLGPLHVWMSNHQGPRPLPPWHECHIVAVPIPMTDVDQCLINGEGVPAKKVYLAHLDYSLRTPFVTVYDMDHRIPDLDRQIREDQGVVARLAGKSNPTLQAERSAADNRLKENIPERDRCIQKRKVALGQCELAKKVGFLAMFSGGTETDPSNGAKLEVWECGVKKPGGAAK